jgi:hypothetical protein
MKLLSVKDLKTNSHFIEKIRWDVTPRIFLRSCMRSADKNQKKIDTTHGYMLYVEIVNKKPVLVVMQLQPMLSQTAGYIYDVPGDLLKEALDCESAECISGMYPLTEKLGDWLKKELGVS